MVRLGSARLTVASVRRLLDILEEVWWTEETASTRYAHVFVQVVPVLLADQYDKSANKQLGSGAAPALSGAQLTSRSAGIINTQLGPHHVRPGAQTFTSNATTAPAGGGGVGAQKLAAQVGSFSY
jgi:hypothetical protein